MILGRVDVGNEVTSVESSLKKRGVRKMLRKMRFAKNETAQTMEWPTKFKSRPKISGVSVND